MVGEHGGHPTIYACIGVAVGKDDKGSVAGPFIKRESLGFDQ